MKKLWLGIIPLLTLGCLNMARAEKATADERAGIRTQLAAEYFKRRQFGVAIEEAQKALVINPAYAPAYGMLALIYMDLQEDAKARTHFNHAVEYAPNDPDIRHNYGYFLCDRGQYQAGVAEYMAALRNRTETFGLGINGKPTGRLTVGGDLLLSADKDKYQQDLDASASAASKTLLATSGGLPDVTFRQFTARMFGKYAIEKNSAVRVDFIHQRTKLNEWTWGYNGTPFVYSDNTTVYLNPKQSVSYLGATYIVALP